MEKLTKRHLGRRLHAEPLIKLKDAGHISTVIGYINDKVNTKAKYESWMDEYFLKDVLLVLRPLSDLTKPIKQANYNDGEEFVLIDFLIDKAILPAQIQYFEFIKQTGTEGIRLDEWAYWAIELLIQLHFVLDEPYGTWIDVNTLDTNPYE